MAPGIVLYVVFGIIAGITGVMLQVRRRRMSAFSTRTRPTHASSSPAAPLPQAGLGPLPHPHLWRPGRKDLRHLDAPPLLRPPSDPVRPLARTPRAPVPAARSLLLPQAHLERRAHLPQVRARVHSPSSATRRLTSSFASSSRSNGQGVAQIAEGGSGPAICFSVAVVIWAILGMIIGQIRSLHGLGLLANSAVWVRPAALSPLSQRVDRR